MCYLGGSLLITHPQSRSFLSNNKQGIISLWWCWIWACFVTPEMRIIVGLHGVRYGCFKQCCTQRKYGVAGVPIISATITTRPTTPCVWLPGPREGAPLGALPVRAEWYHFIPECSQSSGLVQQEQLVCKKVKKEERDGTAENGKDTLHSDYFDFSQLHLKDDILRPVLWRSR